MNRDYKRTNQQEDLLGPSSMIVPKPANSHSNPNKILQLNARYFTQFIEELYTQLFLAFVTLDAPLFKVPRHLHTFYNRPATYLINKYFIEIHLKLVFSIMRIRDGRVNDFSAYTIHNAILTTFCILILTRPLTTRMKHLYNKSINITVHEIHLFSNSL